jgi:hypothetical protein
VTLSSEIVELGLEAYVLALEVDGLAVVPQEVHGVDDRRLAELTEKILSHANEMTGTTFDLDRGPADELEFPPNRIPAGERTQFLIQHLARRDRAFRDLALNPVALALLRHLIGRRPLRFSSHNAFVKWHGEYGYGANLGLHADQQASPRPWGTRTRVANTNWVLTDYTKEGGAFAYVPGSHRLDMPPVRDAAESAIPVECPRGSLIIFHGATWHGAFPRLAPGMRLMIANYYRHWMTTSQEDFRNTFPRELIDDCCDPVAFRALTGIEDDFPYGDVGNEPIPRVRGTVASGPSAGAS